MWETYIAGAAGLMGFYVAMRREIRRSYELLHRDIVNLTGRADRTDGRLDRVDGRFDRLDGRFDRIDNRIERLEDRMDAGFTEVRADVRRLDEKIDMVRGELIGFLGPR